MIYLKTISHFLILITLLLTIFQFVKREEWWIRISDFIHLQLTVLTLISWTTILICGDFSYIDISIMVIGFILTILHFSIIWPYTFLSSKQSKTSKSLNKDQSISILEANVLMYNESFHKLINAVELNDPDIVIAIETDIKWEKALAVIEKDYPYAIKCSKDNTYGLLLYSKLELSQSTINYLIEDDVPSFDVTVKLRNEHKVWLHVLHPKPPSPTENYLSLERDTEIIIIGKKISKSPRPVIVTGDLNDVAWSHTSRLFRRLSGLLDPRIGRGFFNTFHVKYPLMRWPLDHVFHSREFLTGEIKRLPSIDSDHFPIYIELFYEPIKGDANNEETDEVTEDDLDEIDDKLERMED